MLENAYYTLVTLLVLFFFSFQQGSFVHRVHEDHFQAIFGLSVRQKVWRQLGHSGTSGKNTEYDWDEGLALAVTHDVNFFFFFFQISIVAVSLVTVTTIVASSVSQSLSLLFNSTAIRKPYSINPEYGFL